MRFVARFANLLRAVRHAARVSVFSDDCARFARSTLVLFEDLRAALERHAYRRLLINVDEPRHVAESGPAARRNILAARAAATVATTSFRATLPHHAVETGGAFFAAFARGAVPLGGACGDALRHCDGSDATDATTNVREGSTTFIVARVRRARSCGSAYRSIRVAGRSDVAQRVTLEAVGFGDAACVREAGRHLWQISAPVARGICRDARRTLRGRRCSNAPSCRPENHGGGN